MAILKSEQTEKDTKLLDKKKKEDSIEEWQPLYMAS